MLELTTKMKLNINQAIRNGIIAFKEGKPKEAANFFKRVLRSVPSHPDANLNLGVIAASMNNSEIALKLFKKAIESKPDLIQAYKNLGMIQQQLGRLNEAEESYKNVIKFKPDDVEVYYNMGVITEELGRLDESEKNYKKVINLKPDYLEAQNNLDLILRQKKLLDVLKRRKTIDSSSSYDTQLKLNPFIFNREVEEELIINLYKLNTSDVNKTKDARYGSGRCSDFQLFENNNPVIKKVEKDLTDIMSQAVNSDIYVIDSFFNILQAGGGTTPHNHINKFDKFRELGDRKYSLTYYLSIGDQKSSEPGILKLYNPDKEILPSNGSIVIIPSSRNHSAIYSGKTDRVMIGINFYSLI